jgi:type IV secretion system protein TrbI
MSNDSANPAKRIASPTELEKPGLIQLHGRVVGSGRLSKRAAIIALALLVLIVGLIVYGASQNKLRLPKAMTDKAAVIPAAQVAPWWQNQSDAMPFPKAVPSIMPSAPPMMDDSGNVPDLTQTDSANNNGPAPAQLEPARSVSVSAQPYPVGDFPSVPPVPGVLQVASATSPPKKGADANEPPPADAQALTAPAIVGVGPNNPTPTRIGTSTGADADRPTLLSNLIPTTIQKNEDTGLLPRQTPTSPYTLLAGSILSASLVTAIDSDTPGTLLAQVNDDAYDSVSGRYLLAPRGTRLVGTYDSRISYGQNRLGVVWTRLIFPNGASIDLRDVAGSDEAGRAGFDAQVDQHMRKLFEGAILMSILGAGAQLSQPPQNEGLVTAPSVGQTIAGAIGSQIAEVGTHLTQRQLDIAPNLRVPAGYQFTVIVEHDLHLSTPYRGP